MTPETFNSAALDSIDEDNDGEIGLSELSDFLEGVDIESLEQLSSDLDSPELKVEIKKAINTNLESKISDIRNNPYGESEAEARVNAIVLQTYAVLNMGVTSEQIGGIDGEYNEATKAILEKIQK